MEEMIHSSIRKKEGGRKREGALRAGSIAGREWEWDLNNISLLLLLLPYALLSTYTDIYIYIYR